MMVAASGKTKFPIEVPHAQRSGQGERESVSAADYAAGTAAEEINCDADRRRSCGPGVDSALCVRLSCCLVVHRAQVGDEPLTLTPLPAHDLPVRQGEAVAV